jgi:hypothetical protein
MPALLHSQHVEATHGNDEAQDDRAQHYDARRDVTHAEENHCTG